MKIIPNILIMLLVIGSVTVLSSQSTIVLINEIPTRVELDGSEISSINDKVPSYMNGYRKSPKSNFRLIWPGETVDISAMAALDIAAPEAEAPAAKQAISFEASSFALSEDTKANLNKLADDIIANSRTSVLLKSWYQLGDVSSQELTINRLDACKDYLVSKGVKGSLIITSFTGAEKQTDYVSSDIK